MQNALQHRTSRAHTDLPLFSRNVSDEFFNDNNLSATETPIHLLLLYPTDICVLHGDGDCAHILAFHLHAVELPRASKHPGSRNGPRSPTRTASHGTLPCAVFRLHQRRRFLHLHAVCHGIPPANIARQGILFDDIRQQVRVHFALHSLSVS